MVQFPSGEHLSRLPGTANLDDESIQTLGGGRFASPPVRRGVWLVKCP